MNKEAQKLLEKMEKVSGKTTTKTITKIIPFLNNDVPEYLEKLRKWQEESKKIIIRIE